MKLNLEDKKTPAQLLMAYEQIFPGIHPEWIDGVIGIKALPGWLHGNVTSQMLRTVGGLFHRHQASNGEGGWWIASEISIQYLNTDRILQADLAGWKRDQHSQPPDGFPVTIRPDWVCEVCHTTRKKDRELVPDTLSKAGVPYYWFVDADSTRQPRSPQIHDQNLHDGIHSQERTRRSQQYGTHRIKAASSPEHSLTHV